MRPDRQRPGPERGPKGPAMHEQDVFNVMIACDEVVVSLHEVHERVQCCKNDKKVKKK